MIDESPAEEVYRSGWRTQLTQLTDRLADPTYYLAVIGEFSSGKTTFINALLGTRLMPASVSPTTVAPVVVRPTASKSLRVLLADGTTWWWSGGAGRDGSGNAPPLAQLDGLDLPSALARLATDESLTPVVRRVEVGHPAPGLPRDLVLVDTPGTNAEGHHDEVTARAVAEADAAVIVCHGAKVLPETLIRFLKATLDSRLLARCVLVLTHLDQIDPVEHERILRSARLRATRELAITDPQVVLCAPGVVVGAFSGATDAERRHWIDQFAATRDWLRRSVEHSRPITVADTALRLAERLLVDLGGGLDHRSDVLREQHRELELARIADLGSFLSGQRQSGGVELAVGRRAAIDGIEQLVTQARAGLEGQVTAAVVNCGDLRTTLQQDVPQLVRTVLDELGAAAQATVEAELGERYTAACASCDDAFDQEYARLSRAAGVPHLAVPVTPAAITDLDLINPWSFADAVRVVTEDEKRDRRVFAVGTASGAAIGTLFAPVVGTFVGAAIGFFAAARASRDAASVKRDAAGRAAANANAILDAAAEQLADAASAAAEGYRVTFDIRLRWYHDTYVSAVQAIHERQQRQRAEIEAEQQRLSTNREEIYRRVSDVERWRASLVVAPSSQGGQ
ncbi:dynamin family protein [Solwaraspora sp. WMMB762]|uniref:dynamin family protein n=1 Tax=Solwaraspora sp. WMMB762 TaxID=3404120 RepID=UPI003B95C58D